jgi:hypothetical protein
METDSPFCKAVIVVECVPSSADVSARAVTMFSPRYCKEAAGVTRD